MRYLMSNGTIMDGITLVEVSIPTIVPAHIKVIDDVDVEVPEAIIDDIYNMPIETLTPEQLTTLNIRVIVEDPRPDDQYYFIVEDLEHPGKWISTPKELVTLKSWKSTELNSIANQILAQSDWKVTKALELGEAINVDVRSYRASVRQYVNDTQALINAAQTVEDLIEVVANIHFPEQQE